ncbi:uncharacterized protein LOC144712048 [Wolffia australiana]
MRAAAPSTADWNRAITAAAGDLRLATHLFNGIPEPDTVSWNSLLSAYAARGRHAEALLLFRRMRRRQRGFTATTLSAALSSCARLRRRHLGRQIHALSLKTPASSSSPFVTSSLLALYSSHDLPSSLQAFSELPFKTPPCFNALLSALLAARRLPAARRLFDEMPARSVVTWTAMIGGLLREGLFDDALALFASAPAKNSVTWGLLLRGLASGNRFRDAVRVLAAEPDWTRVGAGAVAAALAACSRLNDGGRCGRAVHGRLIKIGAADNPTVQAALISFCFSAGAEDLNLNLNFFGGKSVAGCNALIRGYVGGGRVDEAFEIFDGMAERDGASFVLMIGGFLSKNMIAEAVDLFSSMADPTVEACTAIVPALIKIGRTAEAMDLYLRFDPDVVLSTAVVSALMSRGSVDLAMEIFAEITDPNAVTVNVVLSGLIKHGKIDEARDFFAAAKIKDEGTWSRMISGLARHGFFGEAFHLMKKMMRSSDGGKPEESAIAGLLAASANVSAVAAGEQIHGFAVKQGLDRRLIITNALIAMYGKCGSPDRARSAFDAAAIRDLVSWNAMINGYAINGRSAEAVEQMEKMESSGTKPDEITFLAALSACVHGGLVEQAKSYLVAMESEHGIRPRLEHYSCLVELLCRLGLVEEAMEVVSSMKCEPDAAVWSSLLGGCAGNSMADLAEGAAEKVMKMEPRGRAPYLAMARIYAGSGREGELRRPRKKTKARPGRSWIEIEGETVSFFAGSGHGGERGNEE